MMFFYEVTFNFLAKQEFLQNIDRLFNSEGSLRAEQMG